MKLDHDLLLCPKINAKLSKNNMKPEKMKLLVEYKEKTMLKCSIKFGVDYVYYIKI